MSSVDPFVVFNVQRNCRSMRDAIELLHPSEHEWADFSARIFARVFRRPDGVETGMICIRASDHNGPALRLPNCTDFDAIDDDGNRMTERITCLHKRRLNPDGSVELGDGRLLRAITFRPALSVMYEFDSLDEAITYVALVVRPADGQRCYREVSPELLPGLHALDYSEIARTQLSGLKNLYWEIQGYFPGVSPARIRRALERAGFQFPRSRRALSIAAICLN